MLEQQKTYEPLSCIQTCLKNNLNALAFVLKAEGVKRYLECCYGNCVPTPVVVDPRTGRLFLPPGGCEKCIDDMNGKDCIRAIFRPESQ